MELAITIACCCSEVVEEQRGEFDMLLVSGLLIRNKSATVVFLNVLFTGSSSVAFLSVSFPYLFPCCLPRCLVPNSLPLLYFSISCSNKSSPAVFLNILFTRIFPCCLPQCLIPIHFPLLSSSMSCSHESSPINVLFPQIFLSCLPLCILHIFLCCFPVLLFP